MLALFIKAKKEMEEGYGFPSDIDSAEQLKNRKDAGKDDLKLNYNYQKVLKDLASETKVPLSSKMLSDPSIDEIISATKDAAIVFADATYDPNDALSPRNFTPEEELKRKSHAPVEIVHEPKKR